MHRWARRARLGLALISCLGGIARGDTGAAPAVTDAPAGTAPAAEVAAIQPVDDAWRAALPRDADRATQAYLARLSPAATARANAYFEGGYWLQLWNLLAGLAVSAVLMGRRRSARLAAASLRLLRRRPLADAAFGAAFTLLSFVLTLPLTVYQGFFREHQYGLATQNFGPWLIEQLTGLGVSMVMTGLAVAALYATMRRVGAQWWAWASGLAVILLVVVALIGPVWIDPLFNTYRPLAEGPIKTAVLAMAQANGVPVENVYVFDASRQTNRVSANVSGIFGSAAVRLNDNLLRRCSPAEIRAVMGHELGHYVMNHIYKFIALMAILFLLMFALAQWLMQRLLSRYGPLFGTTRVDDVASFPLLVAVVLMLGFLGTPVTNTLIRTQETEADRFGLNLAREPHGEAEVDLKLTEYRKPDPGSWEEFIFYDHPSTRFRIHDAMRWREAMGTP